MEFRKMLMITLYAEQKKRHRFIEQLFRLCGRRRGWDVSREQHRNMDINLLLVTSFTNIFSHSRCCLLVLSIILFAMQKLFTCLKTLKKFIRSHLFIFSFLLPQESYPKNIDMIYVNMCSAYVLFYEFYGFCSNIQVFKPFQFFTWCEGIF